MDADLRTTLGVQAIEVVAALPTSEDLDSMLEWLSSKDGRIRKIVAETSMSAWAILQ